MKRVKRKKKSDFYSFEDEYGPIDEVLAEREKDFALEQRLLKVKARTRYEYRLDHGKCALSIDKNNYPLLLTVTEESENNGEETRKFCFLEDQETLQEPEIVSFSRKGKLTDWMTLVIEVMAIINFIRYFAQMISCFNRGASLSGDAALLLYVAAIPPLILASTYLIVHLCRKY